MKQRVLNGAIGGALYAVVVFSLLVAVAQDHAQNPTHLKSREPDMWLGGSESRPPQPLSAIASAATISAHDLNVPPEARKQFEKGRELLLELHRSSDSIAFFRKAIDLASLYSQAHFLLGVAYIDLGRYSEAEPSLVKATSINDKNGPAYLALGYCLIEQRKYEASEFPLLHGLESNPDSSLGHYDLARTYFALKHFREAEEHVRKAISLTPGIAAMHALLANLLLPSDRDGALHEFEQTLHLEPKGPSTAQIENIIIQLKASSSPLTVADRSDQQ